MLAGAVLAMCLAWSAANAPGAAACGTGTPIAVGQGICTDTGPFDSCPMANQTAVFSDDFFVDLRGQLQAFGVTNNANGNPIGPSNSPCPHATVTAGPTEQVVANPPAPAGQHTLEVSYTLLGDASATGTTTPGVTVFVTFGLPVACFTPASVDFGMQLSGVEAMQKTVTVTNCGQAALTVNGGSILTPGSTFRIVGTSGCAAAPLVLQPSASCDFGLGWVAVGDPRVDANILNITDNSAQGAPSPQQVPLSGTVTPGSGTCTTNCTPAACTWVPSTPRDRWEEDLFKAGLKAFLKEQQRDLERALRSHPGNHRLSDSLRAVHRQLLQLKRFPDPPRRAIPRDGPSGLSQDDLNKCVDGLIEYTDDFTKTQGIAGKPAEDIKRLVGQLAILKDLLDPEKNKAVKPEDRKKILQDALVALTKELGGAKGAELTGYGLQLYDLIQGNLDGKKKKETFDKAVTALAKKLAGDKAGDLAKQVLILVDVLQGNVDDAAREKILQQAIIGLVTRLGGEGLMKLPQIKAFVTGYDLMKPLGDSIFRNLVVIVNRGIYTRCLTELQSAAEKSGQTYPSAGISTGPWKGNPQATAGWSCATYKDPKTGELEIQAVSPSGKWVILYDLTTGDTVGQHGAP